MDDITNATPRNGGINMTSAELHLGEQPLPNETMNRITERTCTQKLTIPTLEKQDYTNANMWWRRYTVHKDDKRSRFINNDKQQRDTATIQYFCERLDKMLSRK